VLSVDGLNLMMYRQIPIPLANHVEDVILSERIVSEVYDDGREFKCERFPTTIARLGSSVQPSNPTKTASSLHE